jgi:hypothetical protein
MRHIVITSLKPSTSSLVLLSAFAFLPSEQHSSSAIGKEEFTIIISENSYPAENAESIIQPVPRAPWRLYLIDKCYLPFECVKARIATLKFTLVD